MRYWKLFVVALVAVCALGASMAVAAFALPTLLPETVTTGTGKNIGSIHLKVVGAGSLETVECKEAAGESTVEANHHLGLFHIHLKGCGAGGGLLKCTGLGEETGVILALGSWHLVYDTLSVSLAADGVAILYLFDNVHLECGGKLLIVKLGGMVLCLISNPAALTKVSAFNCKERIGGGPAETKYYNEAGTLTSIAPLLTSETEGAGKETILVGEGTNEYKESVLIMT
jgi:hypothetical protein